MIYGPREIRQLMPRKELSLNPRQGNVSRIQPNIKLVRVEPEVRSPEVSICNCNEMRPIIKRYYPFLEGLSPVNEDNGNTMHVQLQNQLEALSSCRPNLLGYYWDFYS